MIAKRRQPAPAVIAAAPPPRLPAGCPAPRGVVKPSVGTIHRCPRCSSADLRAQRVIVERDPADGNAIVFRQRWLVCQRCATRFHGIEM